MQLFMQICVNILISPVVSIYRLVFNFQKNGKRTRMPLVMCETENAGLLREAANAKNDETSF